MPRKRTASAIAKAAAKVANQNHVRVPDGLKADEVLKIITACRSAKVSSLQFKGLCLTFEKHVDDESIIDGEFPADQQVRPSSQKASTPTEQELATARAKSADLAVAVEEAKTLEQVESREAYFSNLLLTDPERYEEEIEAERRSP